MPLADHLTPIYSSYGDDPELRELVEMFVDEMPGRIDSLLQLQQSADWDGLKRFAHQLKGSAGSYGFHALTTIAAHLELAIQTNEPEVVIQQVVNELHEHCLRVRRGIAS